MQPTTTNPVKAPTKTPTLNYAVINPRVCLLGTSAVCAMRGTTSEILFEGVDSGKYLWVFDFAQPGVTRRLLRFLTAELADPHGTRNFSLDMVLALILPLGRATYPPGEVCRRFGIDRCTLKRMRDNLALPPGNFHREPLAKYLATRWVGVGELPSTTASPVAQAFFAKPRQVEVRLRPCAFTGVSSPVFPKARKPVRRTGRDQGQNHKSRACKKANEFAKIKANQG